MGQLGLQPGLRCWGFDATMWPMFGTKQPLIMRPTSAAVGVATRSGTWNVIITGYPILRQQRRRLGCGQPRVSGEWSHW